MGLYKEPNNDFYNGMPKDIEEFPYLFRGQIRYFKGIDSTEPDKYNGEWFYGCAVYGKDRATSQDCRQFCYKIQPYESYYFAYPVDKDTIGQFIHKFDIYDTPIFTGDIVNIHYKGKIISLVVEDITMQLILTAKQNDLEVIGDIYSTEKHQGDCLTPIDPEEERFYIYGYSENGYLFPIADKRGYRSKEEALELAACLTSGVEAGFCYNKNNGIQLDGVCVYNQKQSEKLWDSCEKEIERE